MEKYLEFFKYFVKNICGICCWGMVVIDFVFIVCGWFDGFYEYSFNVWDVVVGIVLVCEVGGIVIDFSGLD